MPKRTRHPKLPVIALALTLVMAACGGGDETGEEVATLQSTDAPASSTTTTARLAPDEALLEFSACMRTNGIDLPDIPIGPDGAPLLDPSLAENIDLQSDEFVEAFTACLPVLASAGAFQQTQDPEELAEQRDQLVGFSQCMRDEGIEDFPDPSLTSFPAYPLTAFTDVGEPDFDAALEVCQEEVAFGPFDDSEDG